MLNYSKGVRQSWVYACEKVKIRSDFPRHLLGLHKPGRSLAKTLLRCHLEQLATFFHVLAHEQPDFLSLPTSDRETLLKRNTALFIQYFLGRFFFAGSGYKQHSWLLLCQVPDYLNDATFLRFVPMTTFDGVVKLFRNRGALRRYEAHAKDLSAIALHVHCNSVVALSCLFDHDEETALEAKDSIVRSREWVYESAGWAADKFNCASGDEMRHLMTILGAMSVSFDASVDWQDENDTVLTIGPPPELQAEYGDTAVDALLSRIDESLDAVPFGEVPVLH